MSVQNGIPEADWDDQVARLGGHFLQTRTWGLFQQKLGREVCWDLGDDWVWLAAQRQGRGGIRYLYAPYGPVVRGDGLEPALASLVAEARAQNALFAKVEPWGVVRPEGLREAGLQPAGEFQPQYLLELDITPTEDELKRGISPSNRNLINQADNRGLSFRISQELADAAAFSVIHNATAIHAGIKTHGDDYYRALTEVLLAEGKGGLYFADHAGQPVAAALCYDWNSTRYYAFAGANPAKNRELKAAVALVWWLIADAKSKGLRVFNYGGVAPEDQPNHPWAGHSKFKRSIGGRTRATLGTWDRPLKPMQYRLYRLAKWVLPL